MTITRLHTHMHTQNKRTDNRRRVAQQFVFQVQFVAAPAVKRSQQLNSMTRVEAENVLPRFEIVCNGGSDTRIVWWNYLRAIGPVHLTTQHKHYETRRR